jgi:epoxyqueuosine reductase QueG
MLEISINSLREVAQNVVAGEARRLDTKGWWRLPLLASSPVDERFDVLPEIAADDHLHPTDLLAGARAVIVFFIPFVKELVGANRMGDRPTRDWALSYVETNQLIGRLAEVLADTLQQSGYRCGLTPATHNFDEDKLMARWSHKHLGYLVGLGRFGMHHLLITPQGCAGRLGSLVTNADIGDHPLLVSGEACLMKAGWTCGKCIQACPVDALAEDGFQRRDCWDRLNENRRDLDYFSDLPFSTHVCGNCLAVVPCSFLNPVQKACGVHSPVDSGRRHE